MDDIIYRDMSGEWRQVSSRRKRKLTITGITQLSRGNIFVISYTYPNDTEHTFDDLGKYPNESIILDDKEYYCNSADDMKHAQLIMHNREIKKVLQQL